MNSIKFNKHGNNAAIQYHYEYLLEENPHFSLAQMIKAGAVYYTMLLQQRGILSGYTYGDYI